MHPADLREVVKPAKAAFRKNVEYFRRAGFSACRKSSLLKRAPTSGMCSDLWQSRWTCREGIGFSTERFHWGGSGSAAGKATAVLERREVPAIVAGRASAGIFGGTMPFLLTNTRIGSVIKSPGGLSGRGRRSTKADFMPATRIRGGVDARPARGIWSGGGLGTNFTGCCKAASGGARSGVLPPAGPPAWPAWRRAPPAQPRHSNQQTPGHGEMRASVNAVSESARYPGVS